MPAPESVVWAGVVDRIYKGRAELTSSDLYWAGVRPGRAAFSNAAAPAIMGEEKLVPFSIVKDPPAAAITMEEPVAMMSGFNEPSMPGPRLE